MNVFCDRLKFGPTGALDCCTGQKNRALIANRLVKLAHLVASLKHFDWSSTLRH